LADRLQAAGYSTGIVGKWHLGEEERFHPLRRGFQEFFGFLPGRHMYFKTQDPVYGGIYRNREPVEIHGYLTEVLAREASQFIDRHQKRPFFLYLAFNAVHTPLEAPDSLVARFNTVSNPDRRTYLAMTTALDMAVGQVLEKIRLAGLERDTLVFFLSD